jgi:hypothetical protein
MSIINCPHCGKPITDKAKTCIHCGKPIVEDIPEPRNINYAELSDKRRKELSDEFSSECPEYGGVYKKLLIMSKLPFIACIIAVALLAVMVYLEYLNGNSDGSDGISNNTAFWISMFVLLGIILVFIIVLSVIFKKYKKKVVYYNKYLQWWLLNKYKIEYSVDYSSINPKYKALFDTIEIDENYFIKRGK